MRALILAGGRGTRMQPLTDHVPKTLLPVANRPFLEHQLRLLDRHGIDDVTLLTGYRAEDFGPFVEEMASIGITMRVSTEDEPLGTAGAVRGMLDELAEAFLVFNSDVLTDLDVGALVAFHREREAVLTIALTPVEDARAYGLVPLDDQGRILGFHEKPKELVPGLINAGTYVVEPRALADQPTGSLMFETDVFPSLVERGEPLYGFSTDAYWLDIGTPERYRQAHADVLAGRVAVDIDGELVTNTAMIEQGRVEAPAIVARPILVGPGAVVGPGTCVGSHCMIGADARVEGSILHDDVRIGVGAIVTDSILGSGVRVPVGGRVSGEVIAARTQGA